MDKSKPKYLDYAATTPVDPRVLEEMLPFFSEHFGNAASTTHPYGEFARKAVNRGIHQVADLIVADDEEIVITSGSTESINLAIKGIYWAHRERSQHIITVKTEHKAVLDTCEWLETIGAEVTYLDVDSNGIINWEQYKQALEETPLLVCIMHVNNETGVIQDIKKACELAHSAGAFFFSDATQSFGKLPLDVRELDLDLMCFSAHKIYGPKGIGGLYVKHGVKPMPLIHGGGHQRGMRSGTLNVPGIVGLGKAASLAKLEMSANFEQAVAHQQELEFQFIQEHRAFINGAEVARSPYISNLQLPGQDADEFILKNRQKISIATGSACNAEVIEPSHVLRAMGLKGKDCIRFSFKSNSTQR